MEDEVIILGLETDQYYSLNAVGARLWQLLEQNLTLQEIHTALLVEYEVATEVLWEDLTRLIEVMAEEHLITIA
jgi:Coenzyme PQQ synthesis protein D (PqqD)